MPPITTKNKSRCLDFNVAPSLVNPQFYSPSVTVNGASRLAFTSGLVGFTEDDKFPASFIEQVKQAFDNIVAALNAAGSEVNDVTKLTFYTRRLGAPFIGPFFAFFADKYGRQFRPVTTFVPMPALAYPEPVAAVGGRSIVWNNRHN